MGPGRAAGLCRRWPWAGDPFPGKALGTESPASPSSLPELLVPGWDGADPGMGLTLGLVPVGAVLPRLCACTHPPGVHGFNFTHTSNPISRSALLERR